MDAEKEEIKTAKVSWDGKQFIIRIPSIVSQMTNINQKDKVEFKVDFKTKEVQLKLVRGLKK